MDKSRKSLAASLEYHPKLNSKLDTASRCLPEKGPIAIYIHIPFCATRCYFCNFAIVVGQRAQNELVDGYIKALKQEMTAYRQLLVDGGIAVETVQIGGGTPTAFTSEQLDEIMTLIVDLFDSDQLREIIIEGFPSSISKEKLQTLEKFPKLKLNIGIQTFKDEILEAVGRDHAASEAIRAIELARQSKIRSVGVDLIFGLPLSSTQTVSNDLDTIFSFDVDHLAFYPLWIYEKTALESLVKLGRLKNLDAAELQRQMAFGQERIFSSKFEQYTIFHYAKDESHKHQYGLWQMATKNWLGFGMGAMSFVDNHIYFNEKNTPSYIRKIAAGTYDTGIGQRFSRKEAMQFALLYGLRLRSYPTAPFDERFEVSMLDVFSDSFAKLEANGYLEVSKERVGLTSNGVLSLTEIERFISSDLTLESEPQLHAPSAQYAG